MKILSITLISVLITLALSAQRIYTEKSFDITGKGFKGVLIHAETDKTEGFYKLQYLTKSPDNNIVLSIYTYDYDFNFIDVTTEQKTIEKSAEELKLLGFIGQEFPSAKINVEVNNENASFSVNTQNNTFNWKKYSYESTTIAEKSIKTPYSNKEYKYIQHYNNDADSTLIVLLKHKKKNTIYKVISLSNSGKITQQQELEINGIQILQQLLPVFSITSSNSYFNGIAVVSVSTLFDNNIVMFDKTLKRKKEIRIAAKAADSSLTQAMIGEFAMAIPQKLFIDTAQQSLIVYKTIAATAKSQSPLKHLTGYINLSNNTYNYWSSYAITNSKSGKLKTDIAIIKDSSSYYQILFEYSETANCMGKPLAIPRVQALRIEDNNILDAGAPEIILESNIPFVYTPKNAKLIFFGHDHPCKSYIYSSIELD